jgi:hypothetical protein
MSSWCNLAIVIFAVLVVLVGDLAESMTLPPIHWNSSNPM